MDPIDFTTAQELANRFEGSEFKKTLLYDGQVYMIKFPDPIREKKNDLSYKNNQFSEYVGCHIFASCGIPVQETTLGRYQVNGKEKIVVACRDFTQDGSRLIEFSKMANADVVSGQKAKTSIENVYSIVENTPVIRDKAMVIDYFWDMFVMDAFIGNEDRHFTNWGFLETGNQLNMAPVYDCGSSLGAVHDDDTIASMMANPTEFKNRVVNVKSVYTFQGKRFFYHELFKNPPPDLQCAMNRIFPRISLDNISSIIENTPFIDDLKKDFLKKSITSRYEEILRPAWRKMLRQQRNMER